MKTRKYIYIILGVVFILLDILSTLGRIREIKEALSGDAAYSFGYLMGSQLFLIIGLLFLFGGYRVQRKINKKKRLELENAFRE